MKRNACEKGNRLALISINESNNVSASANENTTFTILGICYAHFSIETVLVRKNSILVEWKNTRKRTSAILLMNIKESTKTLELFSIYSQSVCEIKVFFKRMMPFFVCFFI